METWMKRAHAIKGSTFFRSKILSCWYLKRQNVRQPEKEMVGATGFEIAFCLFLDFGWVRYLAE